MTTRSTGLMLCVLFAWVAACGGQGPAATGPQAPASQGGQQQATPIPPPVDPSSGTSVVHVEIQGGPKAGTHDATGKKSDCNTSPRGSGATYGADATEGLSSVVFVSDEGGGSPTKFQFYALFGAVGESQQGVLIDMLNPSKPDGGGTAQLDDKGSTITWTIDGTTKDGTRFKATIKCGPVDRR